MHRLTITIVTRSIIFLEPPFLISFCHSPLQLSAGDTRHAVNRHCPSSAQKQLSEKVAATGASHGATTDVNGAPQAERPRGQWLGSQACDHGRPCIEAAVRQQHDASHRLPIPDGMTAHYAKTIHDRRRRTSQKPKCKYWGALRQTTKSGRRNQTLSVCRLHSSCLRRTRVLADNTRKGIPDCWRSAAWEILMNRFTKTGRNELKRLAGQYRHDLDQPSEYDVQIDLDVPRTISGHILFRTRYGQG